MSDSTVPTPGQAAGTAPGSAPVPTQSATPAGGGTETSGQEGVKESYLTRAEVEQLKQDILNQARSYSDKGRVRVEKAVQEVTQSVASLRGLGQAITPEQEKSLRDEAIRKAMVEPESAPVGEQPAQVVPQGQTDPNIVEIQQEKGIELFDGDPELSIIDRSHGLHKFYKSIEAACDTKKTRLASPTTLSAPASRLPAEGSAPIGLPENMSAREAWQRVKHKE